MEILKLIVVFVGTLLLVMGCYSVDKLSKYDDYKKAMPHDRALILPKDINHRTIENHYPMPKVENDNRAMLNVSIVPPGSSCGK